MGFFSREKHSIHNPRVYLSLTARHFKVFFKNKISVIFSLLVPMITLIVYIVFLRQLQTDAIDTKIIEIIGTEFKNDKELLDKAHLLADAWMLSGIIAVSCISVSLNTCTIMITDRLMGVSKDFVSSPISRRSINVSYLLFNILSTFVIVLCVMIVSYIYLGVTGGWYISFTHTLILLPILLLSIISASLITCFIASFITDYNSFNAASVIISSGTGFFIGAFMPVSMLPGPAKQAPLFFPGTYSAGLLRNFILNDYLIQFKVFLENERPGIDIGKIQTEIGNIISVDIDFFGVKVTPGYMVLAIGIYVVIFLILNAVFLDHNLRSTLHGRSRFSRKK